jgi:RimJ/RimL family protein N-acetyltransferase
MGDGSSRAIGLTARPDPTLTTPRLVLRRWSEADLEPFARLNADPEVMRFFSHPLSRAESDAFAERIETQFDARGYGLWVVGRQADGAFLGFTGLAYQDFDAAFTPCVEVGWRLAREAWGHGYATEAAREALRFGFETVSLDEIVSLTPVGHVRSRRVMERLAMHHDPAQDFDYVPLPERHPHRRHVLYRLTRPEWYGQTRP